MINELTITTVAVSKDTTAEKTTVSTAKKTNSDESTTTTKKSTAAAATTVTVTTTTKSQAGEGSGSVSNDTNQVSLSGLSVAYYGGNKVEGDYLSVDEFVIVAEYSDGSEATINGWTSNAFSKKLSAGDNVIDISYLSCYCTITVFAYEKGGIDYPSNPSSTSVNFGVVFADVNKKLTVVQDNVAASSGPDKVANSTGYVSLATYNVGDVVKCTGIGKNGYCRIELESGKIGYI